MAIEVDERLIKGCRNLEEMASHLDDSRMRLPTNPAFLVSQIPGRPSIHCGAPADLEGYFEAFPQFAFSNIIKEEEIRVKELCS